MLKNRVIPTLLLQQRDLVKTKKFDHPTYIGDPLNAIRIFNEKEVDEIIVLDILASRQNRAPDFDFIQELASECFMPLCYGGGVATLEQAERLFDLGVEKISLQTATRSDLRLVNEIAQRFGAQAVVASIDVKNDWLGRGQLYWSADQSRDGNWLAHADRVVSAGAGEVLITSVDRDGMMGGMDLKIIHAASSALPVPLIAMGGVGELQHIKEAIDAGASAVAAGAFFVFYGKFRAVLITYPSYSDLENLLK